MVYCVEITGALLCKMVAVQVPALWIFNDNYVKIYMMMTGEKGPKSFTLA